MNQVVRSVYEQIKARILLSGPIPVADYMKMALTTPGTVMLPPDKSHGTAKVDSGYYMKKDVFGQHGDFITSPEISQMFGEMIGIWGLQTWLQIGGPKKFNIVELGPGRGTLAKDMLRVFKRFEKLTGSDVSLHLVEISPFMANLQEETLCEKKSKNYLDYITRRSESNWIDPGKQLGPDQSYYHQAVSKDTNYPIYWYRDVQSVPKEFNLYIAHEFFDALPIHKLQKVDDHQWREILVDIDPTTTESEKLRFVLSRHETPVIKMLNRFQDKLLLDHRQHIEISLDAITVLDDMTSRIDRDGGIALIVDYGHDGTKEDTFRGFYKHELHDPLLKPGLADLTADVDFSFVRKFCWDQAWVLGPTMQRDFLKRVGIQVRYNKLLESCTTDDEKKILSSGYRMLVEDMGERFKLMGIFPKILENYRPGLKIVGFDA